jgi:amino acid permease
LLVGRYGEAEFVFSIIKVLAVIGFIILGIIVRFTRGSIPTFNLPSHLLPAMLAPSAGLVPV